MFNFKPYTLYLKISVISLQMLLTQLFSWLEFSLTSVRTKSIYGAGKILKDKMAEDGGSRFVITKIVRLGLRVVGRISWGFYSRIYFICRHNKVMIAKCRHLFNNRLVPEGISEIALLGISDMAKIFFIVAEQTGIKIVGIYDNVERLRFFGQNVSHFLSLKGYQGKILISSPINVEENVKRLKEIGIKEENILLSKNRS